jgi:hypothetical protein
MEPHPINLFSSIPSVNTSIENEKHPHLPSLSTQSKGPAGINIPLNVSEH